MLKLDVSRGAKKTNKSILLSLEKQLNKNKAYPFKIKGFRLFIFCIKALPKKYFF